MAGFITGQVFNFSASAGWTATLPSGFSVTNNMLACFSFSTNGSGVTLGSVPTNTLAIPSSGSTYDASTVTTTYFYYKVLVAGVDIPGTTTYAFNRASGTSDWQGVCGIYSGIDETTPVRTSAFTNEGNATGGTLTASVLTSLIAGDMLVFGWGGRGSGTFTAYSGSTEVGQTATTGTNKRPQAQSYHVQSANGNMDAATATFSVTANAHGVYSVALQQAANTVAGDLSPTEISRMNLTGLSSIVQGDPLTSTAVLTGPRSN